MKLVTFKDIVSLGIKPTECLDWAADAIRRKGEATLPPKISLVPHDGSFMNTMPSLVTDPSGKVWGGVKLVTRFPQNEPALDSKLLLLDCESGEMVALMDADWITAMRTGAVAAHSIGLFAKEGWSELSMMGLGNTARSTLLILAESLEGQPLHVRLLRYRDQAERFAERFAEYPNLTFEIVDDVVASLDGCDVFVSCATYLPYDVAPDEAFPEGVLVVPVHTRGFTNCDLFFDKVYADDTGHVHHFGNFDKFRRFAEVADVVAGRVPGRESVDERILAYNIGVSMQDIAFAVRIWELLDKDGLADLDLRQPEEKFWV